MYSYLAVDLINLSVILITLVFYSFKIKFRKYILLLICMLILTAVFDNILIILHFVTYNHSKLLGIYIYKAPIEDFAYSIGATLVVPFYFKRYKNDK